MKWLAAEADKHNLVGFKEHLMVGAKESVSMIIGY